MYQIRAAANITIQEPNIISVTLPPLQSYNTTGARILFSSVFPGALFPRYPFLASYEGG